MAKITNVGLHLTESASAIGDTSGEMQIWTKNTTPNTLFMTNDTGTDVQIGSGMTPIKNIAVTSAANATIDITDFTQYNSLKLIVDNYEPATDATKLYLTHSNDDASSYESANYYSIFGGVGCDTGEWREAIEGGAVFNLTGNCGNATAESSSFELTFPNVHSSSQRLCYYGVCQIWQQTPHVITGGTSGVYIGDTLTTTHLKFTPSSGNIDVFSATLYGINEVAS